MGIDYKSVTIFGTIEEFDENILPDVVRNYFEEVDRIIYKDASEDYASNDEEKKILKEFIGFSLYRNSYSLEFEGAGIEVNPNKLDKNKVSNIKKLFKKYKLGTPKIVSFVHTW